MNFDFYQQFKDFSNTDLLKIVKRPSDFQPEAVVVATKILEERHVTAQEIDFVDQHFEVIDNSAKAKKEKIGAFKKHATDFFEPISHPGENVEPKKWVNIFLLVISLEYAWILFNTAKRLCTTVRHYTKR